MLPPKNIPKKQTATGMAHGCMLAQKSKQPRASAPWLSLSYIIACKLTISRRTTRINISTIDEESFAAKLGHIDYHQSCAPFLRISHIRSVTRSLIPRQVIE